MPPHLITFLIIISFLTTAIITALLTRQPRHTIFVAIGMTAATLFLVFYGIPTRLPLPDTATTITFLKQHWLGIVGLVFGPAEAELLIRVARDKMASDEATQTAEG